MLPIITINNTISIHLISNKENKQKYDAFNNNLLNVYFLKIKYT